MGKWIHRLSDKDTEKKIGTCAKCGLIKLKWHIKVWKCWNAYLSQKVKADDYRDAYLKTVTILECEQCGLKDNEPRMFDVDHKDSDRNNNKLNNLQLLCPNCHRRKTIKTEFNWFTRAERLSLETN